MRLLLALTALLVPAQDPAPPDSRTSAASLPESFHRGVCYVGRAHEATMQQLKELGVTWVSITPFGYGQETPDEMPERYRHSRFRSESVEAMRDLTRMAHRHGLAVTLKPHLWFARNGKWRGDIRPADEAGWWRFYHAYSAFLRPFLELARDEKVELFCLGTELPGTSDNTALWRKLIADARQIYPGKLTYAAHWYEEPWKIEFWDALDVVGVSAYFPLVDFEDRTATLAELRAGWKPWRAKLEALAKKTGKPILFTELGYQPRVGTAHRPWVWNMPTPFDEEAQRNAYTAFFDSFRGADWFHGVHIWKWFSHRRRHRRHDFTPQGLSAEKVLRERFGGGAR